MVSTVRTALVRRVMAAPVALGIVALLGLVGVTAVVVLQDRSSTAASSRPDFALAVGSAGRSAPQGGTATWQLTASGTGGFTGRVVYAVTGLPAGAGATFEATTSSLSPTTPSAQSRLEIATSAATPTGDSVVTVTGTSGATRRSVTAALHVTRAPDGSAAVSAGPPAVSEQVRPAGGPVAPGSAAASAFLISTAAPAPALAPGAPARPLELLLSNPHHRPIAVTDLRVAITGDRK